jgi:hypothetical protein
MPRTGRSAHTAHRSGLTRIRRRVAWQRWSCSFLDALDLEDVTLVGRGTSDVVPVCVELEVAVPT